MSERVRELSERVRVKGLKEKKRRHQIRKRRMTREKERKSQKGVKGKDENLTKPNAENQHTNNSTTTHKPLTKNTKHSFLTKSYRSLKWQGHSKSKRLRRYSFLLNTPTTKV